ncbi:hypothetical protein J132_02359, partial [Termitomyces sp. J132]
DYKATGIIIVHISDRLTIKVSELKHSKEMFDKLVKLHEATNVGISAFYTFMTMLNQKWDRSPPSTLSSYISSISAANTKLVAMKRPIDLEFLAFILLSSLPKDNMWEACHVTILDSLTPGTSSAFPALADHFTFTATAQQDTSSDAVLKADTNSKCKGKSDKYCKLHKFLMHNTSDCHTLKDQKDGKKKDKQKKTKEKKKAKANCASHELESDTDGSNSSDSEKGGRTAAYLNTKLIATYMHMSTIADSGAFSHMTPHQNWFKCNTFRELNPPCKIQFGDSLHVKAMGIGTLLHVKLIDINQTLVNMAIVFLIESGLPKSFWFDAMHTAAMIIGRILASGLKGKVSYNIIFTQFDEDTDSLLAATDLKGGRQPNYVEKELHVSKIWLSRMQTIDERCNCKNSGGKRLGLKNAHVDCCQASLTITQHYMRHGRCAPIDPSLEFLMDDLTAGMTVSAPAVASASDPAKHPVGALAVARGEGRSEGRRNEEAANRGDIQEAGPSTPKAAAGGVARGLAMSPKLVTTPKSKGKGKEKAKAQDEEDEDIEDHVEESFTDKCLAMLLRWRRTTTVVDTGLGAGVKLDKAKGKVTVSLEKWQEYKYTQGACDNCWADNDPEGCWKSCSHSGLSLRSTGSKFAKRIAIKAASVRSARAFVERQRELARRGEPIEVKHSSLTLPTSQEEGLVGGSGGARVKSREMVESDDNDDDNGSDGDTPQALKRAASPSSVASTKRPRTVASEEGREDMEMRETTPLATVAEVEASDMEIKGEKEVEAVPVATEEEERAEEVEVVRRGTWSDTPLRQVGDDELEWLGKNLRWPMPLTLAASLLDFDERAAGVEQRFRRELEVAREELLAAQAHYTVARQTLATLAGYRRDCQAFLAWQEENNIGEGDWEETEAMEVSDNDADLDA